MIWPDCAAASRERKSSIHTFPHILFARNTEGAWSEEITAREKLQAEVLCLKLPAYFENMSSTRIRSNVSGNKDIADLVEPVVQNYIYEKGLYTMEPMYKRAAQSRTVDTFLFDRLSQEQEKELAEHYSDHYLAGAGGEKAVILRNEEKDNCICGAVLYHELAVGELYESCGDIDLAAALRNELSGRTCVLTDILGDADRFSDDRYTVLNEMLAHCQEEGYSYAVCFHGREYDDLPVGTRGVSSRKRMHTTCTANDSLNIFGVVFIGAAGSCRRRQTAL